jgi:hypothetical protein
MSDIHNRENIRAPVFADAPPGQRSLARHAVGRPPGRVTIAERAQRLAFAAACRVHEQAVIDFWFNTMMREDRDMTHRIACSDRLMNRAHGLPMQISQESVQEHRKTILEVRWLEPDPNDRSRLIQPEPD